jgi:ubiquinone/menaquinone biosynthesis C-methylase UbiE
LWRSIPVLILHEQSLFDPPCDRNEKKTAVFEKFIKRLLPPMGHNLNAKKGYKRFSELLKQYDKSETGKSRVLVVGAGQGGFGIEILTADSTIEMINLDIVPNNSLDVIADAHHLPLANESCDGVVIQAVLEHVLYPEQVVTEIRRVLKPGGFVYAETPFLQMVHERAYDFTRFTYLGHKKLFINFNEIESGITGGAGMTLLWAWCYFLRAFCKADAAAKLAMALGRLTGFWLLWVDYLLKDMPGSYDACSGVFFLGSKSEKAGDPRLLVKEFKGI